MSIHEIDAFIRSREPSVLSPLPRFSFGEEKEQAEIAEEKKKMEKLEEMVSAAMVDCLSQEVPSKESTIYFDFSKKAENEDAGFFLLRTVAEYF
jgi:hypothetical protein